MHWNNAVAMIVSSFLVDHIHFQLFSGAYDPEKMKSSSLP